VDNTRWLQTEQEQAELELKLIGECYWRDYQGKFWFNDETDADVCGPFDTLDACKSACTEYAKTI